jgi:hypothetical protein
VPNAYLDTYRAIGNREDLINIITNISPEETVFMSRIGKVSAKARYHEWLTESLQASNSGNAIVEGASATFASGDMTPRSRLGNYTQILRKPWSTSYTQDEVEKAGVAGTEFDHQRALKTKELARDMNAALINQASASGDSGTARTLNGALAAITTNTAAANSQPIQQSTYNALLQSIWIQGGRPNATYVHGFNKRTISSWTDPLHRNIDANGKKLVISVDTYDSDFGKQTILLEREMPTSQVMILEEGRWFSAFLRPLFYEELGKVGEQRRGTVVSELTLEYRAENSSGKITGTATA